MFGSYANRVGKPLLKMRKLSYSILLFNEGKYDVTRSTVQSGPWY
jgi:hypothetical protein